PRLTVQSCTFHLQLVDCCDRGDSLFPPHWFSSDVFVQFNFPSNVNRQFVSVDESSSNRVACNTMPHFLHTKFSQLCQSAPTGHQSGSVFDNIENEWLDEANVCNRVKIVEVSIVFS